MFLYGGLCLRACFRQVEVAPQVALDTGSGQLKATEIAVFASGKNRYLGILRDHLVEDLDPRETQIMLPARRHVYDAREGTYFGETDRITAVISPARARVFSLLPYQVEQVELKVGNIARGGRAPVSVKIRAAGGRPGEHVFHLRVRDPQGQERRYLRQNVPAPGGKGKTFIPIALNEPAGIWTVKARDAATGKVAEAMFRVK